MLERPGRGARRSTVIVFVAGALGLLAYKVDYSTTTFFKKSVESVEGFELLEEAFPPGVLAPMTMLVESDDGAVTEARGGRGRRRRPKASTGLLGDADRRRERRPRTSTDGAIATVDVVLDQDPYTKAALAIVPEIREAVADLGPGRPCSSAAARAIQYDFDEATESDLKLIAPLALLVIAIILAILLRALVAPLVLIASVILSFLCTLGHLGPVHPLRRRRRRLRRLDPDLRLHLPGRARDRLHDLPDGAGARGGAHARHPRGHAAGALGHRAR